VAAISPKPAASASGLRRSASVADLDETVRSGAVKDRLCRRAGTAPECAFCPLCAQFRLRADRCIARLGTTCTAVSCVSMKDARKLEPPVPRLNDPEYWRGRAEEARTIGERMIDGEARESMLRVAEQYEELGRKAERRRIAKLSP
jgi:hypothetical protein